MEKLQSLVNLISKDGFDSRQAIVSTQKFVTDGALTRMCTDLLENEKELDALKDRSFLHAAGIYKLVLLKKTYSEPEVRLHIWLNGNRFPPNCNYDSVHNHRWNFTSAIITGVFQKSLYIETDCSGLAYEHHYFGAVAPGKLNKAKHIGTTNLTRTYSSLLVFGDAYALHNSICHIIEPINEEFSATLFIRQPYETEGTHVFLPEGSPVSDFNNGSGLIKIPKEKIVKFLQYIVSLLDK